MKRMIVLAALIGLGGSPLRRRWPHRQRVVRRGADGRSVHWWLRHEQRSRNDAGKQAVLAWKVDRGTFNGVSLDGLPSSRRFPAPRISGCLRNGRRPSSRSHQVFVDQRANAASEDGARGDGQRSRQRGLMGTIVNVTPTSIQFADDTTRRPGRRRRQVASTSTSTSRTTRLRRPAMVPAALLGPWKTRRCGSPNRLFSGTTLGVKWSDSEQRVSVLRHLQPLTRAAA